MTALLSVFVLASTFAAPSGLFTPTQCSNASAPVEQAQLGGGIAAPTVYCTADCGSHPDVSCSGSVCTAVDRSCSAQRGYVTCDGVTTYCPVCEGGTVCTEGTFKTVFGATCSCEDGLSTPRDRYKCINNQWVYQSSSCGAPFCPDYK